MAAASEDKVSLRERIELGSPGVFGSSSMCWRRRGTRHFLPDKSPAPTQVVQEIGLLGDARRSGHTACLLRRMRWCRTLQMRTWRNLRGADRRTERIQLERWLCPYCKKPNAVELSGELGVVTKGHGADS